MNEKFLFKLENLKKAYQKLEYATNIIYIDDIHRDGIIQRFEFTFELVWKTLREYLISNGRTNLDSPKSVFKEAYVFGIIDDGEIFINMSNDRNMTAHLYDEDVAIEIFNNIKNVYLEEIKKLINYLEERK